VLPHGGIIKCDLAFRESEPSKDTDPQRTFRGLSNRRSCNLPLQLSFVAPRASSKKKKGTVGPAQHDHVRSDSSK